MWMVFDTACPPTCNFMNFVFMQTWKVALYSLFVVHHKLMLFPEPTSSLLWYTFEL